MAASVIIPIPRTQEDLEKVLGGLDRPDGVGRPRITFGADHSGDSSVWIVYPVSKSIPLTKQRIAALNSFAEGVRQSVRELQIDEITYVRFTETGRQAARP